MKQVIEFEARHREFNEISPGFIQCFSLEFHGKYR